MVIHSNDFNKFDWFNNIIRKQDNNKKQKKSITIRYKRWTLVNIMKIYTYNIPKTSQWSYLLTKWKLNENKIIS